MKRLIVVPEAWPCTLAECPPGLFLWQGSPEMEPYLCFKSEYGSNEDPVEAFNAEGEYFWGGTTSKEERDKIMVQPCDWEWEEI